jgi:hypothetical protein
MTFRDRPLHVDSGRRHGVSVQAAGVVLRFMPLKPQRA